MKTAVKKYGVLFFIVLTLGTHLAFGLSRLGNYSSVDEPYWTYGRITKFWNGIKAHKWKTTSINDKPGITVALLSGFGLTRIDPMPYKSLRGDVKTDAQLKDINTINFSFRLPIYLFCVLLLPLFYILLKKLFDEKTALIAFMFISLSPILLGISLIINPDSLLWLFLPLSLLCYFVYQKRNEKKYLLLTGILLGLALLTKYVANILYIFFFLLPFLEYIFTAEKPELTTYLKKSFLDYGSIVLWSMLTFFILYPAAWVSPKFLLEGTFLSKAFVSTWPLFALIIALLAFDRFFSHSVALTKILSFFSKQRVLLLRSLSGLFLFGVAFVFVNTFTGMKVLDNMATLASPKGTGEGSIFLIYADKLSADIFSLIFAVSPLALLGLLFALLLNYGKKWLYSYEAKIVAYLTLFILFYYFASTVNHVVATVRYQIALYPFVFIITAIGLAYLLSIEKVKKYLPLPLAYTLIFIIATASLIGIKPFYFAYTSALLPEKYFVNLKDMGDGSFEAAAFLNNQPHPENLVVWSDKGAVCAVFKGKCIIGFTNKRIKGVHFDYVVVSSGRKSRSLKMSGSANAIINFKKAYTTDDTVSTITIGGRPNNYVKVIDARTLAPIQSNN